MLGARLKDLEPFIETATNLYHFCSALEHHAASNLKTPETDFRWFKCRYNGVEGSDQQLALKSWNVEGAVNYPRTFEIIAPHLGTILYADDIHQGLSIEGLVVSKRPGYGPEVHPFLRVREKHIGKEGALGYQFLIHLRHFPNGQRMLENAELRFQAIRVAAVGSVNECNWSNIHDVVDEAAHQPFPVNWCELRRRPLIGTRANH